MTLLRITASCLYYETKKLACVVYIFFGMTAWSMIPAEAGNANAKNYFLNC